MPPNITSIEKLDKLRIGRPIPTDESPVTIGMLDADVLRLRNAPGSGTVSDEAATIQMATLSSDVTITFPASTGTVVLEGVPVSGNLDMNGFLILNIGAAGTDFTAGGGLTTALGITVTSGGITVTGDSTVTGDVTLNGELTITSTTTPQLTARYDANNHVTISVSSAGAVTYNATGASAVHAFSDSVTTTGTVTAVGAIGAFVAGVSATTAGGITLHSSGVANGLRVYGSTGTHQWDMYLSGTSLRFSDNTGGGIADFDTGATFGGNVTVETGGLTVSAGGGRIDGGGSSSTYIGLGIAANYRGFGNTNSVLTLGGVAAGNQAVIEVLGNRTTDGEVGQIVIENNAVATATENRLGGFVVERSGANNTGLVKFYGSSAGTWAETGRYTAAGAWTLVGGLTVSAGGATVTAGNLTLGGTEQLVIGSANFTRIRNAANTQNNLYIGDNGLIAIRETSNAFSTIGLTINQDANDDEIFSLKSSDVAQPNTDFTEADTFGVFRKSEASSGGLLIGGQKDGDGSAGLAINLRALLGEAADTAKTTAALGVIHIQAGVNTSGTAFNDVGTNGNLMTIVNGGTTRFIFDAEGSAHADVEWTTFDDHNDMVLLDSFERVMRPDLERDPIKDSFGKVMSYDRSHLERVGILGKGSLHTENGKQRGMVNMTKLTMALTGNQYQMHQRIAALEQRLLALGA